MNIMAATIYWFKSSNLKIGINLATVYFEIATVFNICRKDIK